MIKLTQLFAIQNLGAFSPINEVYRIAQAVITSYNDHNSDDKIPGKAQH